MHKSILTYLLLVFLYNLSELQIKIYTTDCATVGVKDGSKWAVFCCTYAIKKALCVMVRGHEVGVVGVLHKDVGALLNYAKLTK